MKNEIIHTLTQNFEGHAQNLRLFPVIYEARI